MFLKIPTPFAAPILTSFLCVVAAFACSGIWDRYPQAAAHSQASGSPAVASQALDWDARSRCGSARDPSGALSIQPPLPTLPFAPPTPPPSLAVTSASAVSKYSKRTCTDGLK